MATCETVAAVDDPSPATIAADRPLWNKLNPREQAIMGWVKRGRNNRDIGAIFGTTEQVIKNKMRDIYRKLGISQSTEDFGGGSPTRIGADCLRVAGVVMLMEEKFAAEKRDGE